MELLSPEKYISKYKNLMSISVEKRKLIHKKGKHSVGYKRLKLRSSFETDENNFTFFLHILHMHTPKEE